MSQHANHPAVRVEYPNWVDSIVDWVGAYASDEDRMRLAIAVSRTSVERARSSLEWSASGWCAALRATTLPSSASKRAPSSPRHITISRRAGSRSSATFCAPRHAPSSSFTGRTAERSTTVERLARNRAEIPGHRPHTIKPQSTDQRIPETEPMKVGVADDDCAPELRGAHDGLMRPPAAIQMGSRFLGTRIKGEVVQWSAMHSCCAGFALR